MAGSVDWDDHVWKVSRNVVDRCTADTIAIVESAAQREREEMKLVFDLSITNFSDVMATWLTESEREQLDARGCYADAMRTAFARMESTIALYPAGADHLDYTPLASYDGMLSDSEWATVSALNESARGSLVMVKIESHYRRAQAWEYDDDSVHIDSDGDVRVDAAEPELTMAIPTPLGTVYLYPRAGMTGTMEDLRCPADAT